MRPSSNSSAARSTSSFRQADTALPVAIASLSTAAEMAVFARAAVSGVGNIAVYAAMRGESVEDFQKTRASAISYGVGR